MIKKRTLYDASYTIEAAIIIPITLFLIIAIIYISFALHDLLIMKTSLYCNIVTHYLDKETNSLNTDLSESLDKKLMIAKSSNVIYEGQENMVTIKASCHFGYPFKGLQTLLGNKNCGEKQDVVCFTNLKKTDFLRKYKAIADLQNK